MSSLAVVFRKLRHVPGLARRCVSNAGKRSFWQEIGIRHLRQHPFWFTDRHGVTLGLYPEDSIGTILERQLHFDDDSVLHLIRRLVEPGMTIVDVGANYGQFTLLAARLVGDDGQVHAFEPTSYSFRRLSENVHYLNGLGQRVHLNPTAVGDQNGHAVLYEFPPGGTATWNSLSSHTMHTQGRAVTPSQTENVAVVTLDKYCLDHKIEQIDLLKIDVEGFEVEVLKGCQRLIQEKRIHRVIFEISLEPLEGRGCTPTDVLSSVHQMGFDIQRIYAKGDLERVLLPRFEVPPFANYLATPRRSDVPIV